MLTPKEKRILASPTFRKRGRCGPLNLTGHFYYKLLKSGETDLLFGKAFEWSNWIAFVTGGERIDFLKTDVEYVKNREGELEWQGKLTRADHYNKQKSPTK